VSSLVIIPAVIAVFAVQSAAAQSVDYGGYRPHYQGYGVNTPGGRGGTVCRVTSLNDQAWPAEPGTLRYCVEYLLGPRFVVFETSGTIKLSYGPLVVTNPYITIAGQTAPSPGILIRGPGLIVDTHDVVVQHVRVRVGTLAWEPHGLWLRDDANNVVIDHVSVSWAVWTSVAVAAYNPGHPPGNITILDSLISESLACSGVNSAVPCDPDLYPAEGTSNSRAMLIGDRWGHAEPYKVSLLRNILAHNNDRHPEIAGSTHTILVNNLIYNPSQTPMSGIVFQDTGRVGPALSTLKANVMIAGPTTPGNNGYKANEFRDEGEVTMVKVGGTTNSGSEIYMDGNFYEKHCRGVACQTSTEAQWMLAADLIGESVHASVPPLELSNLPLSSALPYTEVETSLVSNAGARPRDRDAVDQRIINEIASRTGSVPNTPAEKAGPGTTDDGFPILDVNSRPLTIPDNPHGVIDGVGRTRIEAWLEAFAGELEAAK
jgi:hypothetical protein